MNYLLNYVDTQIESDGIIIIIPGTIFLLWNVWQVFAIFFHRHKD